MNNIKNAGMASPDTNFSKQSSQMVFGASRGSASNFSVPNKFPFGTSSASSAINVPTSQNMRDGQNKLILGFGRSNSRGASNSGRDRYKQSNNENFDQ